MMPKMELAKLAPKSLRRLHSLPPTGYTAAPGARDPSTRTFCRVPGHRLHGRKCIAVAADRAAKIKNTEPGPIGHHRNKVEPYAIPTGRSFDGKGDANDEEQRH